MTDIEKQLTVKRSTIPGAGKGLFTSKPIVKNTRIIEYKGKITTWKEADMDQGKNGYVFYLKSDYVIDARPYQKSLARYTNDANGLRKVKGICNNCIYVIEGSRVFIESVKNIPAGAEILVDYGKKYWEVLQYNLRVEKGEG